MRFNLTLQIIGQNRILPINYQYPLHSWIYRVIQQANAEFSQFLHGEGYRLGDRQFKLFTFSQLNGEPYRIYKKEQRIGFYGNELQLGISFWIPEAAEHFIRGLFMGQQFRLGDRLSQVDFEVVRIEALPRPLFEEVMHYRTATPVVVSVHVPEHKHPQYRAPNDEGYAQRLLMNLQRKAEAVGLSLPMTSATAFHEGKLDFADEWKLDLSGPFRRKGIFVKQHTPMQNKIIGYIYHFEMIAPPEVQQLAYYAGLGEDNSMGFGYCDVK
uniref:CRISPR-associated endoribonuclease Cas6 n=1 Tax=Roseihalotalea indica TaxID=2867963 RepID=A0AA49GKU5_9BACT|nr:CRISPR-associated endoribonuclease Cas6 [Tunicatimonas sp. TK19036]